VARNVAHCLALLAAGGGGALPPPLLISVLGTDPAGEALLAHWRSLGLSTERIRRVEGAATPSVCVVFDAAGDVAASVADVALLESAMTPEVVRSHGDVVAAASLVMLDGDLGQACVEVGAAGSRPRLAVAALRRRRAARARQPPSGDQLPKGKSPPRELVLRRSRVHAWTQEACRLASSGGGQVWFEPVSAAKSTRAVGALHLLHYASPNRQELAAMAAAVRRRQGQPPAAAAAPSSAGDRSAAPLAAQLQALLPDLQDVLGAGLRRALVTLGPAGAALCALSADRRVLVHHAPALPARVVNCSGAGDCMVAGFMRALLEGRGEVEALAWGVAAAKRAVESPTNVPLSMPVEAVRADAQRAMRLTTRHELRCV
jgi:receptor expression-enhancing protein 5/6